MTRREYLFRKGWSYRGWCWWPLTIVTMRCQPIVVQRKRNRVKLATYFKGGFKLPQALAYRGEQEKARDAR